MLGFCVLGVAGLCPFPNEVPPGGGEQAVTHLLMLGFNISTTGCDMSSTDLVAWLASDTTAQGMAGYKELLQRLGRVDATFFDWLANEGELVDELRVDRELCLRIRLRARRAAQPGRPCQWSLSTFVRGWG